MSVERPNSTLPWMTSNVPVQNVSSDSDFEDFEYLDEEEEEVVVVIVPPRPQSPLERPPAKPPTPSFTLFPPNDDFREEIPTVPSLILSQHEITRAVSDEMYEKRIFFPGFFHKHGILWLTLLSPFVQGRETGRESAGITLSHWKNPGSKFRSGTLKIWWKFTITYGA